MSATVTPADAPEGISFLVHRSTVERIDITAGPISTTSGAGIGTTEEELTDKLWRSAAAGRPRRRATDGVRPHEDRRRVPGRSP
ncbi:MAG: hypothetical protein R2695_07585 [Acidimicrobiales bacterium]